MCYSLEKNAKIKIWRIRFSCINFFSRFQFTGDLHDALNEKNSIFFFFFFNSTGNEIFRNIRTNAFSVKLASGVEIVLKISSGQKDVPFISIICKSVP